MVTDTSVDKKAGWAKIAFTGNIHSDNAASITMTDKRTGPSSTHTQWTKEHHARPADDCRGLREASEDAHGRSRLETKSFVQGRGSMGRLLRAVALFVYFQANLPVRPLRCVCRSHGRAGFVLGGSLNQCVASGVLKRILQPCSTLLPSQATGQWGSLLRLPGNQAVVN